MSGFRQLLDQALNNLPAGLAGDQGRGAAPRGTEDLRARVQDFTRDPRSLATGAIAGGLLGMLMSGGKPSKLLGNAVKVGGAAVIGGLAWRAYRSWQDGRAGDAPAAGTGARFGGAASLPPPPAGSDFAPDDPARAEALAEKILRAMVAAAKADGHVTSAERRRITAELRNLGLGAEAEAMIAAELDAPLEAGHIAALATNEAEAAELYAASLLVVDPEAPAERAYLADLAAALRLHPGLVARLHAEAEAIGA